MSCTVANCEGKCFGMVTLKILTTTCLCYNSDKKTAKFPVSEMNLSRVNTSFPLQVIQ